MTKDKDADYAVLDLEKFSPTVAEMQTLADKYKGMQIKGADDKEGYKQVDQARKELKHARSNLEKMGKAMRKPALDFQKAVIQREKELVAIIEPVEKELVAVQVAADLERERENRKKILPDRLKQLEEIKIQDTPELRSQLLEMDEWQYLTFYNAKNTACLKEKAARLKQEELAFEEKKKASEPVEEPKVNKIPSPVQYPTGLATADDAPVDLEKAVETVKSYKDFLMAHGVTEDNVNTDFYLFNDGKQISLFKKIDEFIIVQL